MALRTPQRPWMPPHGAQRASWRASGALQMDLAGPERQGRCQEGPARLSQRRSWHPLSARTDHPAHRGHRRHRVPQEAQATHAPARGLALFWFQTLDRASRPQADTKPGWQDQTQHLTSPYGNMHIGEEVTSFSKIILKKGRSPSCSYSSYSSGGNCYYLSNICEHIG